MTSPRPLHMVSRLRRQRGVSLIGAIFLITSLAMIGALVARLMVMGSVEAINEWYSAQALYAAESGVDWNVYTGNTVPVTDQVVIGGRAWFDATVTTVNIGGRTLVTITSTGKAGESLTNIRADRRIVVQYMR